MNVLDGGTQIFYTENESEIVSIHTDEQGNIKIVFKSSIKSVYGQMILMILFIRSLYMQLTTQTFESEKFNGYSLIWSTYFNAYTVIY